MQISFLWMESGFDMKRIVLLVLAAMVGPVRLFGADRPETVGGGCVRNRTARPASSVSACRRTRSRRRLAGVGTQHRPYPAVGGVEDRDAGLGQPRPQSVVRSLSGF